MDIPTAKSPVSRLQGKLPTEEACEELSLGNWVKSGPHPPPPARPTQVREPRRLTAVRGCDRDGLGRELIVKVPCVDLGCDLRFEGWQELWRRGA